MNTKSSPEATDQGEHQRIFTSLQDAVSQYLIRHRSILDVISKFQEANARVNRAVAKAVTACGCVEIQAGRQSFPADITYWEMREHMATHIHGEICEHCREVLEQEIGRQLFYLAALCDVMGLDLHAVAEDERKRIATLGVFNLT